jgi:hypothetical protein|tara:strand:- start:464 stop:661 length:198 start_codon:yes stop_codon:yes gene_type:complete
MVLIWFKGGVYYLKLQLTLSDAGILKDERGGVKSFVERPPAIELLDVIVSNIGILLLNYPKFLDS